MTASKPKTPTASGISRLLAAAGRPRAVIAMRGGHAGFSVTKCLAKEGTVHVEYYANTGFSSAKNRLGMLARYAKTITEAGYAVVTDTARERLIVTAKTED